MKIIKEDLDNLERVQGRQTVQGIMMKDAEEQSKKSEDNFKEVAGNPEDLKKKKPFISGEKQPKPKDVETPKPELEESLFEEAESSVAIYKDSYTKLMYVKKELKQNASILSLSQLSGLLVLATNILNFIDSGIKTNMNNNSMDEELDVDVFTPEEARAYWEKEHDYDPVLSDYDSFSDWYEDSVANGYIKESCQSKLNEAEGTNRVFQYSVDIIESPNHSSRDMSDKILGVLQDAGIRAIGCMSSDTSWSMTEYGLSESKDVRKSIKLHEAGGVKDGILYSTYGEPLTFWDKIYAELDGNLSNDNDYTKLIELPVKVKNKYQEISVTNDGNIRVFSPSEEGLQHALDVAEHYGLDYESGASTGYSDPAKAFYCTVIIPEERQEEFVTYDARKYRPVKKDNIKVA